MAFKMKGFSGFGNSPMKKDTEKKGTFSKIYPMAKSIASLGLKSLFPVVTAKDFITKVKETGLGTGHNIMRRGKFGPKHRTKKKEIKGL